MTIEIQTKNTTQTSLTGSLVEQTKVRDDVAQRKFVNHFMYVFKAPYVTFPGYEDMWTKDLRDQAFMHRLTAIEDIQNEMASDFEVMFYLSTASFIAPMHAEFAHIYMYTFSKYFDYDMIEPGKKPPVLDAMEKIEYTRIKEWLYKTQWQHVKSKMDKAEPQPEPDKPQVIESLADFLDTS